MQTHISTSKSDFPANVPLKLIKRYRQLGENQRALARDRNVNPGHIHKLLVDGIEPVDPDIRKKLWLPGKVRAPLDAWVREATENLRRLEELSQPLPGRTYNRNGKRVR